MKSLGYVNLFWLHEFMNSAIRMADNWYRDEYPKRCDWEDDNYVLGFGERSDLFLQWFIQHGLLPAFKLLSQFQAELVLDALAAAVANDEPSIWKYVNYFEQHTGRDETLSEHPAELFGNFFDILAAGKNYSLADFKDFAEIKFDEQDRLTLYQHC